MMSRGEDRGNRRGAAGGGKGGVDDQEGGFSNAGKQLMLVSLLAKDKIISNNGKAFLKGRCWALNLQHFNSFKRFTGFISKWFSELILRRDKRIGQVLHVFERKINSDKNDFLENIHELIRKWSSFDHHVPK
jgi:hypothetical protein